MLLWSFDGDEASNDMTPLAPFSHRRRLIYVTSTCFPFSLLMRGISLLTYIKHPNHFSFHYLSWRKIPIVITWREMMIWKVFYGNVVNITRLTTVVKYFTFVIIIRMRVMKMQHLKKHFIYVYFIKVHKYCSILWYLPFFIFLALNTWLKLIHSLTFSISLFTLLPLELMDTIHPSHHMSINVFFPSRKDLITRVILLSGSALSPWAIQKEPLVIKRRVAEQTNCHGDLLVEDIAPCLRNKSIQELLNVSVASPR